MTAINADDLLQVFVSENPRARTDAMERLIEAAWRRGFQDALKAHGITERSPFEQMRYEEKLEEAEMGLA